MRTITIADQMIGEGFPTYFVADIAANHDGDLSRAVDLIHLAADAGADAAKFQHFRAETIVSREGFDSMEGQVSHQSSWKKSVFEVYQDASVPWEWTEELKRACDEAGLHFFSSPYDLSLVDKLDAYMPAYKVGSGDITWIEELELIAEKGKPVLLATGASTIGDVQRAVDVVLERTSDLVLMQCNTNYTASLENFRHIHLNVLRTYAAMYPEVVLGLSDHTPGHVTVLGAVALGARVVEKHFTDDQAHEGPDHAFSMDPPGWREMVDRTRELEAALGSPNKTVAANEQETAVIQRRCLRAARPLSKGAVLGRDDLIPLRPAPRDGIFPYDISRVLGAHLIRDVEQGAYLKWTDLV